MRRRILTVAIGFILLTAWLVLEPWTRGVPVVLGVIAGVGAYSAQRWRRRRRQRQ